MEITKRYYLVKFRQDAKLTQIEAAQKLKLTRSYYVSIETAQCMPSFEVWLKIQKLLKIDDNDMWKVITRTKKEVINYGAKN